MPDLMHLKIDMKLSHCSLNQVSWLMFDQEFCIVKISEKFEKRPKFICQWKRLQYKTSKKVKILNIIMQHLSVHIACEWIVP